MLYYTYMMGYYGGWSGGMMGGLGVITWLVVVVDLVLLGLWLWKQVKK